MTKDEIINWICRSWAILSIGLGVYIFLTSAYFPFNFNSGSGVSVTREGNDITITFTGRLSTQNSSAGTLSLGDTTINTFSGTTSTWTLPVVSGHTGRFYVIKNKGTGTITLNSNSGGLDIFDDTPVASITLLPEETYTIFNDGLHWCTKP